MGLYDEDPKKLPFFTNVPQGDNLDEPIFSSLFEINFILPRILRQDGRDPRVLLYSAKQINLPLLTPDVERVTQRYKYSTRIYAGNPNQTHLDDISIMFEVNQDIRGSMYVWNTLKAWYDLVHNTQTGELNYTRDLVGTMIINHHDKRGNVIRRVILNKVFIFGLNQAELNWEGGANIFSAEAKFSANYFTDFYIDQV
jgi:hypothetical protein